MSNALTIFIFSVIMAPLVLALALGFTPLHSSIHRWMAINRSNRLIALWAIFITAWLLSWTAFAGIVAYLYYSISSYYFDTSFGQVIGVTRATIQMRAGGILTELWSRQVFGWLMPETCFSRSIETCQLADAGEGLGFFGVNIAIVALLPAALSFAIARWLAARPK
jgi:hypothetical protein